MSDPQKSIYTLPFLLVCFSSFLFSASFNMLIPDLPAYLTSMGGAEFKGLIIALFTLTAGISRPFSGKLTDKIGRVPVMAVGSLVCFVCGFLYPILTSIAGFLFLRLIHGFSTGFKPTATSAYVADSVPAGKWGEAMGIHGVFFSTGMAIGPAIGSAITQHYSINVLFYCSSLFALASILIIFNMKETLPSKQRFKPSLLKMKRNEWINKQAMPAFWVTIFSYVSYGAIITLIPDWTLRIGIANKGIFFMVFTIASLLVRFVAGKSSDKFGRKPIIKFSMALLCLALLCLGIFETANGFLIGAVIYGVATGMLSPAVSAWTIDLSDADKRGLAVATVYIALEAGIGLGAFFSGWYVGSRIENTPLVFYAAAIANFMGLVYLYLHSNKKSPLSPKDKELEL
ncbi:MFS transporter [Pelobium manganitolerans]|uniref:MFS transporter n=1 Tax=Pelobium manganitolerans TaxID=1842495 RepID=A0A419SB95_9SPHI|nr:MFS transporter [Pelobium manganitolerans]RKD20095.1 MFS transporter [Pelobium manganitolerans]